MEQRKASKLRQDDGLPEARMLRVEATRFRLPFRCSCGGALSAVQIDGIAAISIYQCGAKWIGWEGPAGPALVRDCTCEPAERPSPPTSLPAEAASPERPKKKSSEDLF